MSYYVSSLLLLLPSSLLPSLLSLLLFQLPVTADFDINPQADHIDPATNIEFTIVYHGCVLYLYLLPLLYYDIQYLMGCYSIKTTVCDSRNRVNSNCDHDLVHYRVVYTDVHAYYVVQLLLYNIQRSI